MVFKKLKWGFAPFLIWIISSILSGCNSFQSLEYRGLSDWDLKGKSLAESRLSAIVKVYNPNKYQITVKRIEADIDVNGSVWSKYKIDSVFNVPALSDFSFPINLTVKNSDLLSGGLKLVTSGNLPYTLNGKIKGSYRGLTAEVPFIHQGKFSEKDIKF